MNTGDGAVRSPNTMKCSNKYLFLLLMFLAAKRNRGQEQILTRYTIVEEFPLTKMVV